MIRKTPQSAEEWFHRKATDYVEAQILYHLNRAGLFQELEKGPQSAHDLATGLGLVPQVLQMLLEYVEGVDGLIARDEEGRFALTEFGREVLARYGRPGASSTTYNFFDVRVGAYGEVWSSLGDLLSGKASYGGDLKREGERAAEAVYTVGKRLEAGFLQIVDRLGAEMALELGVTSGLLNILGQERPATRLFGVDRSQEVLDAAEVKAQSESVHGIRWIPGDIFDLEAWVRPALKHQNGLLFTVHFHEFLAGGIERVQAWLKELRGELAGWHIVAIEQPRLPAEARDRVPEVEWLYNHSNILIHHLIGNGRILSDARWRKLFEEAGLTLEDVTPMNFLGYQGYVYRV